MTDTLGIGILGVGFMGRTHIGAWSAVAETPGGARLVAVADRNPQRRSGRAEQTGNAVGDAGSDRLFDPDVVRGYETPGQLLADDAVHAVSICTPTDTHVGLAIQALQAGKHVLVEKPVALSAAEVARLADAARASDRVCMPAMCIRFWPAWARLREAIRTEEFGALRGLSIERVGDVPTWSQHFYDDPARSGGALIDLHIHDADFLLACCGDPAAVSSGGHRNHVTSVYRYDGDGPSLAVATGGWVPGVPFRMTFLASFENVTVDYVFGRDPELRVLRAGQDPEPIVVDSRDGYFHQTAHFLETVRGGGEPAVTLEDALAVTRLLEAEARSQESGEQVELTRLA